MWIFLSDSFLSIVNAVDRPNDLLVRARRAGDIERVFPKAQVFSLPKSDYRYRAFVPRADVAAALAAQVTGIGYTNFKNSVADNDRHDAYLRVWQEMVWWQNSALKR